MIGNDMQEDMVAAELGLATGLILDGLIEPGFPQYTPTSKDAKRHKRIYPQAE